MKGTPILLRSLDRPSATGGSSARSAEDLKKALAVAPTETRDGSRPKPKSTRSRKAAKPAAAPITTKPASELDLILDAVKLEDPDEIVRKKQEEVRMRHEREADAKAQLTSSLARIVEIVSRIGKYFSGVAPSDYEMLVKSNLAVVQALAKARSLFGKFFPDIVAEFCDKVARTAISAYPATHLGLRFIAEIAFAADFVKEVGKDHKPILHLPRKSGGAERWPQVGLVRTIGENKLAVRILLENLREGGTARRAAAEAALEKFREHAIPFRKAYIAEGGSSVVSYIGPDGKERTILVRVQDGEVALIAPDGGTCAMGPVPFINDMEEARHAGIYLNISELELTHPKNRGEEDKKLRLSRERLHYILARELSE